MLTLLTGQVQSGKTSALLKFCSEMCQEKKKLFGVVAPGVFDDTENKVGVDVKLLPTLECYRLANRETNFAPSMSSWKFDASVLKIVNEYFCSMTEVPDVFVVDEIGPLELFKGEGLIQAFNMLKKGPCVCGKDAIVVVRQSLVVQLKNVLEGSWCDIKIRDI